MTTARLKRRLEQPFQLTTTERARVQIENWFIKTHLALFSTVLRLFLLSHTRGHLVYPILCRRVWTLPGNTEHRHMCVRREFHGFDCRCRCGRHDRDGRTLLDTVMYWRAEGYLERPVKKNVYAQILAEVRKGSK